MTQAEAEVAEEEAAQAFEALAAEGLKAGDLQAVAHAWAEALRLREASDNADGQVVAEMRTALAAIRAALDGSAKGSAGQELEAIDADDEKESECRKADERSGGADEQSQGRKQRPAKEAPTASSAGETPKLASKAGSLSGSGGGLRPNWAR